MIDTVRNKITVYFFLHFFSDIPIYKNLISVENSKMKKISEQLLKSFTQFRNLCINILNQHLNYLSILINF